MTTVRGGQELHIKTDSFNFPRCSYSFGHLISFSGDLKLNILFQGIQFTHYKCIQKALTNCCVTCFLRNISICKNCHLAWGDFRVSRHASELKFSMIYKVGTVMIMKHFLRSH
jgi:hypothetical protein